MKGLVYFIAIILIIIWAIGFLAYASGAIIHLLLVVAVIMILFRMIRGSKPM